MLIAQDPDRVQRDQDPDYQHWSCARQRRQPMPQMQAQEAVTEHDRGRGPCDNHPSALGADAEAYTLPFNAKQLPAEPRDACESPRRSRVKVVGTAPGDGSGMRRAGADIPYGNAEPLHISGILVGGKDRCRSGAELRYPAFAHSLDRYGYRYTQCFALK